MADVFGEAVFELEVNNKAFEADLRRAESVTRKSTTKMAADMSKVGAAATNVSGRLGVAGAAAGLVGGEAGAAISPLVGMATAVTGLGVAFKTALPILIAVSAAIAAAAFVYKQFAAASKIASDAEEEAIAIQKRFREELVARQRAEKLAIKALEDRIRLAKGDKASDLLDEGPVKQLQLELERIGRVAKHREVLAAVKKRRQDDEKRRQEELLNIEKQRVQEVERLAMAEFKARRAAGRARESGQAPAETAREARVAALTAAGAIRDTERSTRLMLQALTQLVTEGSISVATARSISGLAPGETAAGGITGGRVGGAIAASSFAGGAGVVSASPAVKMNKILETVAKQSKEQVDLLKVIAEKDGSPGP